MADTPREDEPADGGALSIGLRLPQYGTTWPEMVAAAGEAERLGFASLWVNDHLRTPGRLSATPAFDALTTLAALAPLTRRARLGVAVLSASYRPAALAAKMATVIDVISGGRLIVGLGSGSDRGEHAAYGVPFDRPAERAARLERTLAVFRAMWKHPEGADLPGQLAGATNMPAPVGPPPIWLAANGPRLLELTGRRADGLVCAFTDPAGVARRLAVAREHAAGRPLACALYTYALAFESEDEALGWLAPEAAALGRDPRRVLRWLASTGIVGDPAEVRAELAAHAAAGVTDAILVLPNRVPAEAMRALAAAVLPAPRASAADAPVIVADSGATAEANLAHFLVERHRAADRGAALAIADEGGAWTFDDLSAAAARAAGAMAARGVGRGDRVVVALRDGRAWAAAYLGALRRGAVAVAIDPAAPAARTAEILADCAPALVVSAEPIGRTAHLAPEALADGPPMPVAAVHPEDLAYFIYSSGSTGRPKAAMHAHRDPAVSVATYGEPVLGIGPDDRCHSIPRLFTSFGFGQGFFRALGSGAAAITRGAQPTPRSVLELAAEHGVTVLSAVPTFWAQLVTWLERHPNPEALVGVRIAVSSGDALPAAVAERLAALTGLELVNGLGCSECSNTFISTRPGDPAGGGLGRAVPGVEVKLADDDGVPVAAGAPGRLWVRSEGNTTGYWRRADLTRELVFGPWLRLGDVLVEDQGGYRHVGRRDTMFKVDARWVSPTEVEAVLIGQPGVREVAVVPDRDERGLSRVAAFVVGPSEDPNAATELRRAVAHAIGSHAAPRRIVAVDELPRMASGKLDRGALSRRLSGDGAVSQ